jgi:hypothetical protein
MVGTELGLHELIERSEGQPPPFLKQHSHSVEPASDITSS